MFPRMERFSAQHAKGFSLIELLVSISVLIILFGIAVPGFSGLLSNSRIETDQHKLHSLLSLARSKAVYSNSFVIVCRWNGRSACTGASKTGTLNWQTGALLFADTNNNRIFDSTDRLIKIVSFDDENSITWNRGEMIVYEGDGSVYGTNGTFRISSSDKELTLVISQTGRVRRTR